ncbi:MAG: LPS-assembly protein LptD [Muribaculaceae bacterium]|nr:LPS-assembly protein LptD [Muribaculaceae bacterium]
MRTGVGNTPVADSEPQVEEKNHLPEIVASNLSPEDTLIGIKPLTRRNIQILSDSSAVDMPDADSLSVGMIDVDSLGNDTVSQEISDKSAISADSIDDDRDDFTRINREKVDIETAVAFSAKDSVVLLGNNLAYLFGEGKVEYGQFKLDADEIKMVMDSTTVYATGRVDSLGELIGKPVFQDGGDTYESKSMSFNFKNQRGFITDIVTEQGEGYLTGGRAKKMEDGSFFAEDAIYTTCDEHEHPHFYFQLTRGKIRPGKDVVSGPVYMVVADIPLPLALPFGYFPFSKEYSSGIIFPTFGDDYNRGFYMRNGGYYFAFSDYVDLAVTGEIYTKGSWGISGRSSYRKRYKYSGSFNISFLNTVTGDKGLPDYAKQNNFQVVWSHSMDQKSNPNLSFSASVNFSTSGYTRNDLNSYYSNSFTENTKSSTVNMTYRFPGTKWTASASANISQRTQDSTLAVSFPNLNVTLSQVAPFKRKKAAGAERWYEKIKLSYSGQFQNSLTAQQDVFFKKSLIKDWRNGIRHSVPVSATFSVLKYINLSPSLNMTDRMYTSKIKRDWDPNKSAEVLDTCYGFYNIFDFQASLSADTKLYGFYKPMKFLGNKVQMIRHVLTPSLSYNYTPDFSAPMWGAYGQYSYVNNAGENITRKYNYFQHGVVGSPGSGMSSSVTLSLANNLEMKVRSDQDSTGVKKISLIENLSLSQSYNFAADSMNWSNLNTSILLRLTKSFNLNLNATWDPYTYALDANGNPVKVNRTRLQAGKGWVKLTSTGTSFSYTINNSTFKKKKNDKTQANTNRNDDDDDYDEEDSDESFADQSPSRRRRGDQEDTRQNDADGYSPWECPWSLSFNYSINYGLGTFNYKKMDFNGKFTQNLSISGNIRPTKNWNFSMSCSYDFQAKKIAYMNCNISRDMHCFTMTCSIIPVGMYKSFNFNVAVKSSLLKDIKYDKQSSRLNGINW